MKRTKILFILKFLFLWVCTIIFFVTTLFISGYFGLKSGFNEIGDNFLNYFLLIFIYVFYYLGIGYFLLLLLTHVLHLKFSAPWFIQLIIHLIISYTLLYIFYINNQDRSNKEILLGFLVVGITSVFMIFFRNKLFNKMSGPKAYTET